MWGTCIVDHEGQGNGKLHYVHACIKPLDNTITWFRCSKSNIEHIMRHFLQQLLIILDPLLKSHDSRVAELEELSPDGKFYGKIYMFPEDRTLMKNESQQRCISRFSYVRDHTSGI